MKSDHTLGKRGLAVKQRFTTCCQMCCKSIEISTVLWWELTMFRGFECQSVTNEFLTYTPPTNTHYHHHHTHRHLIRNFTANWNVTIDHLFLSLQRTVNNEIKTVWIFSNTLGSTDWKSCTVELSADVQTGPLCLLQSPLNFMCVHEMYMKFTFTTPFEKCSPPKQNRISNIKWFCLLLTFPAQTANYMSNVKNKHHSGNNGLTLLDSVGTHLKWGYNGWLVPELKNNTVCGFVAREAEWVFTCYLCFSCFCFSFSSFPSPGCWWRVAWRHSRVLLLQENQQHSGHMSCYLPMRNTALAHHSERQSNRV